MKEVVARISRVLFSSFRRSLGMNAHERRLQAIALRQNDLEQMQVARFDSIDGRLLMIHRDVIAYREGSDEARDAMAAAAADQFGAEVARLDEMRDVLGRKIAHRLIHESLDCELAGVDQGVADLLKFSESSLGFRADAGLWFNPPIVVEHAAGEARMAVVNERIVETPFVVAQVATLPTPCRILDVGADESTVFFAFASLGYDVTALAVNGYPFVHPNPSSVSSLFEEFRPLELFDAVICLSSIEHFGLGAYGPDSHDLDADVKALEQLRAMTRSGGRLALTTPYGDAAINSLERTYDDAGLARLLAAWNDPTISIAVKRDDTTWSLRQPDEIVPTGTLQVALVSAVAG